MAGSTPTHIPIPKNHADFERKAVVLFREILKDPSVKRLGRDGQEQFGVDLIGYRDEKVSKIVGIQCKKKAPTSTLTADEVRAEVKKALKYSPQLKEYIIITTAKNDTALDQLAQKLTLDQAKKKRNIRIEVWGWGTLEELIDEYPSARQAFDPGWSPSLQSFQTQLNKVTQAQKGQPTAAQVQGIADQIQQQTSVQAYALPPDFAESQLKVELERANKRRGFGETKIAQEFGEIAARVTAGNLVAAPIALRADALERAARANLAPETIDNAKRFHAEALRLGVRDTSLYHALLPDAEGNGDETLKRLSKLDRPEARAARFNVIARRQGAAEALSWMRLEGYSIRDLGAAGSINLLLRRAEEGDHQTALTEAEALSADWLEDFPALRTIRANLLLAAVLPSDQRGVLFQGLPINPRMLQFASIPQTQTNIAKARAELEAARSSIRPLNLTLYGPYLDEQILWLRLEDLSTVQDAKRQIEEEIKDPDKTLRRVRLALAYKIPFNRDALQRSLTAKHELGQATADDQYTLFLLAWFSQDVKKLAEYFDKHHAEVFSRQDLSLEILAHIEAEALTRVGRFEDAKARVKEHRKKVLSEQAATTIGALIASVEEGNETERVRNLYETDKELTHLRLLVLSLFRDKNFAELTKYAPILVKEDKREEDYDLAQKAFYAERQYKEIIELSDQYPELHARKDEFASVKGWALFHLGRVLEARTIARELVGKRHESNDRELDINTAMETGDWGHIQSIVAREVSRISQLDPVSLIRLARLAFECGSPYVDQFRDAAIAAAPDKPEPYLAAYQLSVDRGEEYQESRAHEWFQKAVELSGPTGPIQHVKLQEIVNRTPGWNERVENANDLLAQAQIPLNVAARVVNRQPIELYVGVAKRNQGTTNPKQQFPVLAFSGARGPNDLDGLRRVALDITALYTLDYLGLLGKVIGAFDQVRIAPSTLSSLFIDRQFIRFRQPSEVAKARYIKDLIAKKRLKIIKSERMSVAETVSLDIDPDLHQLLNTARENKAIVVRSAPVFKLRSLLEEKVDMSAFSDCITDTLEVLRFLKGRLTNAVAEGANAYLAHVDQGWPFKSKRITKRSVLYLDQLSVVYLHHVGLLDTLTQEIRNVFIHEEVESHCDSIIQSAEASAGLLSTVERIRSTLNAAIESQSGLSFTARRQLPSAAGDEEQNVGEKLPSVDIMSDLSEVDAVVCDDRYLIHEGRWSDGKRAVPCVTTLDLICALNSRGKLPEPQIYEHHHRLRAAGYHPVPFNREELKHELARAEIESDHLVETPELTAIRRSLTIAYENHAFVDTEAPWLNHSRQVIFQVLRDIWSERRFSAGTIARANWLLALLPNPLTWVRQPADERAWSAATQIATSQLAMLVTSPFSRVEQERRYGTWVEERLLKHCRSAQPALYRSSIKYIAKFLRDLVETKDAYPIDARRAVVRRLVLTAHPDTKKDLLDLPGFAAAVGIPLRTALTLNGIKEVELTSFVRCIRNALAKKRSAQLNLADGSRATVKTSIDRTGIPVVILDGLNMRFPEGSVLSTFQSKRTATLARMLKNHPLLRDEEKAWQKLLRTGPLKEEEFVKLTEATRETPEAFVASLSKPQNLNGDNMVPRDRLYFERLVGPIRSSSTLSEHARDQHASFRSFMLGKGDVGLRRLAYGCLSDDVMPLSEMPRISLAQTELLLAAFDPFSLLFGFEICVERYRAGDEAALAMGRRFLERLFKDPSWLGQRCEMFSACAVITSTRLRSLANELNAPLYWFRLAVLAHAGVLTNALSNIKDTTKFLEWAVEAFSGAYTWQAVPDLREEPRWDSEWIGPDSIRAEIVGRCLRALGRFGKRKAPVSWTKPIETALNQIDPKMSAIFPGPLDGFRPASSTQRREADIQTVQELLKKRDSFKQAPGLLIIAYAGGIDISHIDEMMRLLEGSNEELASPQSARLILTCCAYVATTTRSATLADAVITRCLRLVTSNSKSKQILPLMLCAMRACAAHEDLTAYYREIGKVATRFAYATAESEALDVRTVMEALCERDPRMVAALGRAMLLLVGSSLAA
ncbi:HTH domain-containing protein [Bradyrhizobium sp. cf659]|uniref:HTH domain-containing protein n=1 Tax=Bradyrhizobium sp. cf659 TaxID=1761771 RepID=UPI0008E06ADC|nr:restriction endonuclease [Bradyrhizobium sp. cf659]SFJ32621.1 Restriction endonuclease [Bradyrhizobium sp. cf659]